MYFCTRIMIISRLTNSNSISFGLGFVALDLAICGLVYWYKKRERNVPDCVVFHFGAYGCGLCCSPEVNPANLPMRRYSLDCTDGSLRKLIELIENCKSNVDIALFQFANPELIGILAKLVGSGRTVRLITDGTRESCPIPEKILCKVVYQKKTASCFHHKFIIIDNEMLLQGSCNFTNSSIRGNCENVLVISNKCVVQKYIQLYEYLWTGV